MTTKATLSSSSTSRVRRTNEQVQAAILSAISEILCEKDFTHITLMDIARRAKTDPNVILRQFGSLEKLLDRYVRSTDYWMHDLLDNEDLKLGQRSDLERMFSRMVDFLYDNQEMQRILLWELTDVNDTTHTIAGNREQHYADAYAAYESKFTSTSIPFRQIASLMVAGAYYLVLHRNTSTFGGVDYSLPEGRVKLRETLLALLDLMYRQLEHRQRVNEASRKLRECGVSEQVIKDCLNGL